MVRPDPTRHLSVEGRSMTDVVERKNPKEDKARRNKKNGHGTVNDTQAGIKEWQKHRGRF